MGAGMKWSGRGDWRAEMRRPVFLLMTVGVLVAMPILLPMAIAYHVVERRRMRKAGARFSCVRCGAILGPRALDLADQAERERAEEMRRQHPFFAYRTICTCHAICPACGTRYAYLEHERTYVLEADVLAKMQARPMSAEPSAELLKASQNTGDGRA
jgi:hypothetical protein